MIWLLLILPLIVQSILLFVLFGCAASKRKPTPALSSYDESQLQHDKIPNEEAKWKKGTDDNTQKSEGQKAEINVASPSTSITDPASAGPSSTSGKINNAKLPPKPRPTIQDDRYSKDKVDKIKQGAHAERYDPEYKTLCDIPSDIWKSSSKVPPTKKRPCRTPSQSDKIPENRIPPLRAKR